MILKTRRPAFETKGKEEASTNTNVDMDETRDMPQVIKPYKMTTVIDCKAVGKMDQVMNLVEYEPLPPATYDVVFTSTSPGTGEVTQTATEGVPYILPTIAALGLTIPTGYTFKGYADNSAGTGTLQQPGASLMVTAALHLYLIWEEITVGPEGEIKG